MNIPRRRLDQVSAADGVAVMGGAEAAADAEAWAAVAEDKGSLGLTIER